LKWKESSGKEVALGIISAYSFAAQDIFRATTHNKGIMNGVDAVCLALG
jgi:hydroxymethylglutaryl-CoA reductase